MRPALPHRAESGTSVVEVLVTMAVLSIVMSIFTTGVLQAYRVTNATEAATITQTQLNLAFRRLDKEIRYASWIASPGLRSGAWYVEFAAPQGCRQLRFDSAGTLQLLRWTPGSPPVPGSRGQTLASELVYDATRSPFVHRDSGSTPPPTPASTVGTEFVPDHDRLQVRLNVRTAGSVAEANNTFTALNTARGTPPANKCSEGRP